MGSRRTAAVAAAAGIAATAAVAGLHIPPRPFPPFPQDSVPPRTRIPLPDDLPLPVHRWLRGVYGDSVPVIDSVVVSGRARMKPFGIGMPARFRFLHQAGQSYRHYIEATWYGLPFLRVNERYLDGRSLIEIPLVGSSDGPQLEQAANLGMWAELAAAAPAVLVTDERVGWGGVDETTATLHVPLRDGHDTFTVFFDPVSGELREMRAWRYRDAEAAGKTLWTARCEPGPKVPRTGLPSVGTAAWADQRRPWARFVTEDIRTNVDVAAALRRRGP